MNSPNIKIEKVFGWGKNDDKKTGTISLNIVFNTDAPYGLVLADLYLRLRESINKSLEEEFKKLEKE
jgi:hypothetical protein